MSENISGNSNQQEDAGCTHDCSSCSANCSSRNGAGADFSARLNPKSSVKRCVGVVSGKGGVGKSLVTSLMACAMSRAGFRAAILDADITGPSIPHAFGLEGVRATGADGEIDVLESKGGIQMMSMNFMLEDVTDPVVWRGSMIASAVKQFWTDVIWKDVDFMFVDMPPGTGDVPLTVFQSLKIDGIIIVTSPQDLVGSIVQKAVKMAGLMKVPVLGMVENMSYVACPDCGKKIYVYGKGGTAEIAQKYSVPLLAQVPIDPRICEAADSGKIEDFVPDFLDAAVAAVRALA